MMSGNQQDDKAIAVLRDVLDKLDDEGRAHLLSRVRDLLDLATREERERCVRICRHRADLWTGTPAASSATPARDEARARANEARYLADFIESNEDMYPAEDA